MRFIDRFLDTTTMYRVVLYYLAALVLVAAGAAAFHMVAYDPVAILCSALFLMLFGSFVNDLFALAFRAQPNVESAAITGLILALIVKPPVAMEDFLTLAWISVLANGSKYLLAINKKHLGNPVAVGVALLSLFFGQSANWWVGTAIMAPFVFAGGVLVTRKIRREAMISAFFVTALVLTAAFAVIGGAPVVRSVMRLLMQSSLLFFAFAMFTEPLTSPHTKRLQILFAVLTGALFIPNAHIGSYYFTPEIALIIGNVFSYLVSPKERLMLPLTEIVRLTEDTADFVFPKPRNFSFVPGQYMEWTLTHPGADSRGNRRYFTLASAPTEQTIRLGVKFNTPPSSYKAALAVLPKGAEIVASGRSGDFVLPGNPSRKLAFFAGGIGVTPFRSMVRYLSDMGQRRDIILMYVNKYASEIVYRDVFDAASVVGVTTVYSLTDKTGVPAGWNGEVGRVDEAMVLRRIPDIRERTCFVSGPNAMVRATSDLLVRMGVPPARIRTDFFPGFA